MWSTSFFDTAGDLILKHLVIVVHQGRDALNHVMEMIKMETLELQAGAKEAFQHLHLPVHHPDPSSIWPGPTSRILTLSRLSHII